jgi:hypothetical protein
MPTLPNAIPTVTVGGLTPSDILFASSTSIKLTTPSTTVGAKDIVITNYDAQAVTSSGGFTYYSPTQTLAVSKSGTGSGTITSTNNEINCGSTCSYAFTYGTTTTLTATPTASSTFTGWSGACSGTGTCSISMTSATTTTATFTLKTFDIGAYTTGGGTLTPTGTTTKDYASSQTYTITPESNYHIESLTVDGVPTATTTSYTFSNITANHTITSVFHLNPPTITGLNPASGTLDGGTSITITGTNFTNPSISFGGTPATSITSVTPTQIVVVTPSHTSGPVTVTVTNEDNQQASTSFTYLDYPPTITSVTSPYHSTIAGYSATITGTNFQNTPTSHSRWNISICLLHITNLSYYSYA